VADDVAQDAFIRAWKALGTFDLERPFGPWVCRIAANLAVNHVRSPRAREEALPEGHAEQAAVAGDPLVGALDAEAREVLGRALETLPREQRAVFVLRVYEEQSYKEIAESLDISIGTVMSRLSRAREKLRAALVPYLGRTALEVGGGEP
jgi:RNA polymerase sigma-70 factor (ECF subfamily)